MHATTSEIIRKKVVVVGDGACGKTVLLLQFYKDTFDYEFVPTVYENFVHKVTIDGRIIELWLWDTAGQEDWEQLRLESYPEADAVLICFSIDWPESLQNAEEKWVPEVLHFCPGIPYIFVGCKSDLRYTHISTESSRKDGYDIITKEKIRVSTKQFKAWSFVECSAKSTEGVKEVFEEAARAALVGSKGGKNSKKDDCVVL